MPLAGCLPSSAHSAYSVRCLLVLALVIGAHGLALLWLAVLAGSHTRGLVIDSEALLVLLVAAPEAPRSQRGPPPQSPRQHEGARPPAAAVPEPPALASAPPAAAQPIDWSAEAQAAASRSIDANEAAARRRSFGMPPPSPMFAPPRQPTPGIPWDYAATHRIEPGPSGSVIFNVNEHCAVGFWIILPFFGCRIGKIPVRGDLFQHMHDDPDPGEPR